MLEGKDGREEDLPDDGDEHCCCQGLEARVVPWSLVSAENAQVA